MADTSIDRLTLQIEVLDGGASSKIDKITTAVTKLNTVDFSIFDKLSKSFLTLRQASLGVSTENIKWVSSLGTRLTTLSKRINEINTEQLRVKFTELATAVDPFISKLTQAQASLVSMNNIILSSNRWSTNSFGMLNTRSYQNGGRWQPSDNNRKFLNFSSIAGRIWFIYNTTKRLGQALTGIVQKGIDFTETLNLWQTAMRSNVGQARQFVSELNKAYGISESTIMNYQALFKNMLSALGTLSENTSYNLSESLTQMAVDYASLYNVSISTAMTKFQAVLSGQVRPIRNISGYDITQNTIQQLYEQMGGTKSVRQLNETEKRLLRIYAVFQQMGESGALGDLNKTLTTNANQLRIMKEQAIEFATWVGNGISFLIQESGILVNINALLYTAKELAKAFAYSLGYREENFIANIWSDADNANEAIEELQGKLMGFDKFQVLQDAGTNEVDIEAVIAKAIASYQSLYKEVNNPAYEKASKMLENMGLNLIYYAQSGEKSFEGSKEAFDEWYESLTDAEKEAVVLNKVYDGSSIVELGKQLLALVSTLGILLSMKLVMKIGAVIKEVGLLKAATQALAYAGIFLIIYGLTDLIKNWDKMTTAQKAAKIALVGVGVAFVAVSAAMKIKHALDKVEQASNIKTAMTLLTVKAAAVATAVGGIGLLITNVALLASGWENMQGWQKAIGILGALGAAATAAAAGIAAFHGAWSLGTATVAIIGSLAAVAAAFVSFRATQKGIGTFASGGIPDKGSMFIAGESGAELVTTMSGGQTGVMNMEQLQTAITRGMLIALASTADNNDDRNIYISVDGQKLFTVTRDVAKRNGYDLTKVR